MIGKLKSLSANEIKMIAIFAMVIDHIAWVFIPAYSIEGYIMHIIGRITAPVMCFFITQGYFYTRNVKKYLIRLLIVAFLSQIPYMLYNGYAFADLKLNVIFNLFSCLTILVVYDKIKNIYLKIILIVLCFGVSYFCDWTYIAPLWCLAFWVFKEDVQKRDAAFSAITILYILMSGDYFIICVGVYLGLILIHCYNGCKSRKRNSTAYSKWFFYFFYSLHMIAIYIVKNFLLY